MAIPTASQVRAYARGLGFDVEVSITDKTLKVRMVKFEVRVLYNIGRRFMDETSRVSYGNYTVTIRYA